MIAIVPFEISPGGHLLIDTQIGGRRLNALLDTGAGSNVLDLTTARALGLRSSAGGVAAGMTGSVAVSRISLPAVTIGNWKLPTGPASAVDLSPFSLSSGRRIDIVLGRPFFENVRVEIDFSALRLRITPLSAPATAYPRSLPISVDPHGRIIVPAVIGGTGEVGAMHDLGSGIPLYISPGFAARHGLLENRKVSESATVGVEGLEVALISTLDTISIAGVSLKAVPFQVPRTWNQETEVVVGLPVWKRFKNLIDLHDRMLGLAAEEDSIQSSFPRDRSGIGAERLEDRLKIIFVSPGSPAEAAKLMPGDEVTKIDGESVGPALYQRRPRPGAERAGTVERLDLASGRSVTITLADYF